MDAPTCSGVKTEYTAEILAKYQSRCFSPTIGHIRCTCITLLIPATKIAKIFQIITIWNVFEKTFQKKGEKTQSIYRRPHPHQKTSLLGTKKSAHMPAKCHPSPFIHKLHRRCKETEAFSPQIAPFCKADVKTM